VPLQRVQVVVDLLPGQPGAGGQRAGRAWLGQRSQQPGPHRVQRRLGRRRIVNDRHRLKPSHVRCHASTLSPTIFFVKTASIVGWAKQR
jgi:hypothetical protein